MKTTTIFKYFALFLALTFMSCGSDDDSSDGSGGGSTVTAISLGNISVDGTIGSTTSGTTSIYTDQTVNFTILDNLGNNISSTVVVTINGNTETLPYTFTTVGTYEVVITYTVNGTTFTAEYTIIVTPAPIPTAIILSAKNVAGSSNKLEFIVMDDLGINKTANSTITLNGAPLANNPYTFDTIGNYTLEATFVTTTPTTLTSNTVDLKINNTHTTKVVMEDYTGTWCGYCPRLAAKIDNLAHNNANIVPVAIHDDTPFGFGPVSAMMSAFGVTGYPTGKISRTITWNESDAQVLAQTNINKPLGLSIDSNVAGSTLTVTAKVNFTENTTGPTKLVVYLLEDGLIYDQVNYMNNDSSSPWYQAGNPIVGFVHDNVARQFLSTGHLGDDIPTNKTYIGSEFTKDYTYTIPSNYNIANLELVAFVTDSSKKVINTQYVKVGQNQSYD